MNDEKYQRTALVMYKAKNGKSVTIPIDENLWVHEAANGKLILNVSIVGLLKFLQDSEWITFKLNKIVEE
jgi:hypothetical protein